MAKTKETTDTAQPESTEEKIDGQCKEPGCKSTRVPDGKEYVCPVHAPKN